MGASALPLWGMHSGRESKWLHDLCILAVCHPSGYINHAFSRPAKPGDNHRVHTMPAF